MKHQMESLLRCRISRILSRASPISELDPITAGFVVSPYSGSVTRPRVNRVHDINDEAVSGQYGAAVLLTGLVEGKAGCVDPVISGVSNSKTGSHIHAGNRRVLTDEFGSGRGGGHDISMAGSIAGETGIEHFTSIEVVEPGASSATAKENKADDEKSSHGFVTLPQLPVRRQLILKD
jgi:hypothetical protein